MSAEADDHKQDVWNDEEIMFGDTDVDVENLHLKLPVGLFPFPFFFRLESCIVTSRTKDQTSETVRPLASIPSPSLISKFLSEFHQKQQSTGKNMVSILLRIVCVTLPPLKHTSSASPLGIYASDLDSNAADAQEPKLAKLPLPLQHVMEIVRNQLEAVFSAQVLNCLRRTLPLQKKDLDIVDFRLSSIVALANDSFTLRQCWYQSTLTLDLLVVKDEVLEEAQQLFIEELKNHEKLSLER